MKTRFALISLLFVSLASLAGAQDNASERNEAVDLKGVKEGDGPAANPAATANRKAYDDLYSDILKTLPQDGRIKIDSARGHAGTASSKPAIVQPSSEERKNEALEKRKKAVDDLSPEIRARVDKALKDLDKRRKEKKAEFKELK